MNQQESLKPRKMACTSFVSCPPPNETLLVKAVSFKINMTNG